MCASAHTGKKARQDDRQDQGQTPKVSAPRFHNRTGYCNRLNALAIIICYVGGTDSTSCLRSSSLRSSSLRSSSSVFGLLLPFFWFFALTASDLVFWPSGSASSGCCPAAAGGAVCDAGPPLGCADRCGDGCIAGVWGAPCNALGSFVRCTCSDDGAGGGATGRSRGLFFPR